MTGIGPTSSLIVMRKKNGSCGRWGIIHLAAVLTIGPFAPATADDKADNGGISTRKGVSEPRKYDATLEVYNAKLPIQNPYNKKPKRLDIPDIPEVNKKHFSVPGLPSDPVMYRRPTMIERAPARKKNWILPPKPHRSDTRDDRTTGTDSIQNLMETLREEVDAQMSTKDRLRTIVDRLRPTVPRPNEPSGYLHQQTENRLRQASGNLIYTEDSDSIVFEPKSDNSDNDSANVSYAPVVIDQVFANRARRKRSESLVAVRSDQNLENISKNDLALLENQEAQILSYAREENHRLSKRGVIQLKLPGVGQFTRANGLNNHLGLRRTQTILSNIGGQRAESGSERGHHEETRLADTSVVSDNSWKSAFSILASALRPSRSPSMIPSSVAE